MNPGRIGCHQSAFAVFFVSVCKQVRVEPAHEILGVAPDASEQAIERAYRQEVKRAHPDNGGSTDEFRAVREAYETLLSDDAGSSSSTGTETDRADSGASTRSPGGRTTGGDTAGQRRDDGSGDQTVNNGSEAADGDAADPEPTRVEYLNYEILAETDWTLADHDLFERASQSDLDAPDYGEFLVQPGESLLEGAEERGFAWPFACRGGACANCAVAIVSGDLSTPANHVLPDDMTDRGIRLSCNGMPLTRELQVVFNLKHLPELEELRLPPTPFERSQADD